MKITYNSQESCHPCKGDSASYWSLECYNQGTRTGEDCLKRLDFYLGSLYPQNPVNLAEMKSRFERDSLT